MALLFASPSLAQSAPGLPQSAIANPYLFQGARYDAETGFYYFRNRYYDPRAGRFLQRDPVWDEQNVGGHYTFVGNNPASFADPSGEIGPLAILAAIAAKKVLAALIIGAGAGVVASRVVQEIEIAEGSRTELSRGEMLLSGGVAGPATAVSVACPPAAPWIAGAGAGLGAGDATLRVGSGRPASGAAVGLLTVAPLPFAARHAYVSRRPGGVDLPETRLPGSQTDRPRRFDFETDKSFQERLELHEAFAESRRKNLAEIDRSLDARFERNRPALLEQIDKLVAEGRLTAAEACQRRQNLRRFWDLMVDDMAPIAEMPGGTLEQAEQGRMMLEFLSLPRPATSGGGLSPATPTQRFTEISFPRVRHTQNLGWGWRPSGGSRR
jgi:RHS repeat-associated protein